MAIHTRKDRLQERRSFAMGLVRRILQRVVRGDLDAAEGFARVRVIYEDQSELLEDVKPLVDSMESQGSEGLITGAREWLEGHAVL